MAKRPYRIDPAVAHERAVKGGKSRTTVDYHARKLVEGWPELTVEQRDRIRSLLLSASQVPAKGAA